jgi:hypothetical protein
VAAFCALWYSSRGLWTVFWFFFAHEAYWEHYGIWTAAVAAVIVSAILFIRMAVGWLTRRYLRIVSWGVVAIVAWYCAVRIEHVVQGIDGWTARGAAENHFAYLMKGSKFYPDRLPRRLVEETTPLLVVYHGTAYALYVGESRAAEIHVMPYYKFWWTVRYSRHFSSLGGLGVREQHQKLRESPTTNLAGSKIRQPGELVFICASGKWNRTAMRLPAIESPLSVFTPTPRRRNARKKRLGCFARKNPRLPANRWVSRRVHRE